MSSDLEKMSLKKRVKTLMLLLPTTLTTFLTVLPLSTALTALYLKSSSSETLHSTMKLNQSPKISTMMTNLSN